MAAVPAAIGGASSLLKKQLFVDPWTGTETKIETCSPKEGPQADVAAFCNTYRFLAAPEVRVNAKSFLVVGAVPPTANQEPASVLTAVRDELCTRFAAFKPVRLRAGVVGEGVALQDKLADMIGAVEDVQPTGGVALLPCHPRLL